MNTTRNRLLLLMLCLIAAVSAIHGSASSAWRPDFSYDASAPLDLQEVRVIQRGEIAQHDISFASPVSGRIKAYLLIPPGQGPFAGILYVHWLGDAATSNRSQFLNEATAIAKDGTVCLLVDAAWSNVAQFPWTGSDYARDREVCVRQIKDLRRALDVLLSRTEVDAGRIGYVGHDFGAMAGAQLAGIDKRVRSYVLVAGTPRYHYWFFRWSSLSGSKRPQYIEEMAPVEPVTLISDAAPANLLFQLSRRGDVWVSEKEGREFYEAAGGTKTALWYNADHSMSSSQVRKDRAEWLGKQLLCSGEFSTSKAGFEEGRFGLTFKGDEGRRYRLEVASSLGQWITWTTIVATGDAMVLTDAPVEGASRRFYRAVLEQ